MNIRIDVFLRILMKVGGIVRFLNVFFMCFKIYGLLLGRNETYQRWRILHKRPPFKTILLSFENVVT
jgi:hypothetical protein